MAVNAYLYDVLLPSCWKDITAWLVLVALALWGLYVKSSYMGLQYKSRATYLSLYPNFYWYFDLGQFIDMLLWIPSAEDSTCQCNEWLFYVNVINVVYVFIYERHIQRWNYQFVFILLFIVGMFNVYHGKNIVHGPKMDIK